MGQRWHPHCGTTGATPWVTSLTKWVHCPGSQNTLWDAKEEHPGKVHGILCGFRGGTKDKEMDRLKWSEKHGKTKG